MGCNLQPQACGFQRGETHPLQNIGACNTPRGRAVLCPTLATLQNRSMGFRREAATAEAPAASPSLATSTYPTEAARRTAFSDDFTEEILEPTAAEVQGSIPAWLQGSFIRNGPGCLKGMNHLFDGYAMLVKVELRDGCALVQQRFVQSVAYQEFRRTGQVQYPEFRTNASLLTSLRRAFEGITGLGQGFTDNSSVSVVPSLDGSQLLALTESVAGTYRARTGDLATLSRVQFKDGNKDILTTAHPTIMEDGSLINLTVSFGTHYRLVRQDRNTDVRTEIAKVPLSRPPTPSWVHDFPVTQSYAVIPETPIFYDLLAAASGGGTYGLFEWDASARTRLHLVDLRTGAVRQLDAPPYFTFHYINSFEAPGGAALCFDLSDFGDPAIINSFLLDNLRAHSVPLPLCSIMRVTVPLGEGATSATMERLLQDDADVPFCELPRVNPAYKGKPYRYAYVVSAVLPACYGNALAKIDVVAGTSKRWHDPGSIPVEPIMVPRPGAEAEDDGAVLAMVTGADGGSFLLILDAASFEEVARVKMPIGLPYGFHGTFIPAK